MISGLPFPTSAQTDRGALRNACQGARRVEGDNDRADAYVTFPILAAVAIGLVVHLALMTTSFGVVARGAGGNPKALARAGWSRLGTRVVMYMIAGLFGLLPGLVLLGLTTTADAHVADRYTLYSIAASFSAVASSSEAGSLPLVPWSAPRRWRWRAPS